MHTTEMEEKCIRIDMADGGFAVEAVRTVRQWVRPTLHDVFVLVREVFGLNPPTTRLIGAEGRRDTSGVRATVEKLDGGYQITAMDAVVNRRFVRMDIEGVEEVLHQVFTDLRIVVTARLGERTGF